MKSLFVLSIPFFVFITTAKADAPRGNTWCFCNRGNTEIDMPWPYAGEMSWQTTWLVKGGPKQNIGRRCGKGGYVVDGNGNALEGPFIYDVGRFSRCYVY
jgi:hypothetical protein